MEKISSFIKPIPQKKSKFGGASYSWQDKAVRYAQGLGISNVSKNKNWFRMFRITPPGILDRAYTFCKDLNMKNPETYFYWTVNKFRKELKINKTK